MARPIFVYCNLVGKNILRYIQKSKHYEQYNKQLRSKGIAMNQYEYAIYTLTDAIDFHRKSYIEFVKEKESAAASTHPIGFNTPNSNNE